MTFKEILLAFGFAFVFAVLFFLLGYWVDHRERKRLKEENKALRSELNLVTKALREAIIELGKVKVTADSANKFADGLGKLATKLHNDWVARKKGEVK